MSPDELQVWLIAERIGGMPPVHAESAVSA
jgi:hypothetical protein